MAPHENHERQSNIEAWKWCLGESEPDQCAFPALADDLSGLPAVFLDVGTVDLFRDDTMNFAQRLMTGGVPCELHVYPGVYHGSEFLDTEPPLSQRMIAARHAFLRRALSV
jgi:acetyl esterase/lipase